jgi:hypothetical protein
VPTSSGDRTRNVGKPADSDPLHRWAHEPSTAQLPAELAPGAAAEVAFEISDDLPRWNAVGRVHQVSGSACIIL